jgi:hypothetical protein
MVMSVVGALPILGAATPGPVGTFSAQVPEGQPSPEQTTDNRTGSDGPATSQGTKSPEPSPGSAEIHPGGVDTLTSPQPPADANINDAYVQPTPAVEPPQPGQSSELSKSLPGTGSSLRDLLLLSGLAVTVLALAVLALLYAARRRYSDPLLR